MKYAENVIGSFKKFVDESLYRDSCYFNQKKCVKDLRVLNRDLSKTILIDVSKYNIFQE